MRILFPTFPTNTNTRARPVDDECPHLIPGGAPYKGIEGKGKTECITSNFCFSFVLNCFHFFRLNFSHRLWELSTWFRIVFFFSLHLSTTSKITPLCNFVTDQSSDMSTSPHNVNRVVAAVSQFTNRMRLFLTSQTFPLLVI